MRIIPQRDAESADSFAKRIDAHAQKSRIESTRDVSRIIKNVKENGDSAIYKYEKKFDGIKKSNVPLRLSHNDIKAAYDAISNAQYTSLKNTANRMAKTETSTLKIIHKDITIKYHKNKTHGNAHITRKFVPLSSVGCYIPGGLARYPSSAIMSIIPAAVAGVPRIVAVSPVSYTGEIDPLTIVAADMCGATEIYRVGGAHAIAALAYGTSSIARVNKIVGPGGSFVTSAKSAVSSVVGVDMIAGPTELGIIADSNTSAKLVALDLISQSEHSADTQCYVITQSKKLARDVSRILDRITATTPPPPQQQLPRSKIVKKSLAKNGFFALVKNSESAITVANQLASEHLQIMTKNPMRMAESITTPGMILCGMQSPSAASDYTLGSNHVLPTNRQGRIRGSLSVFDFVKMLTLVESSRDVLCDIQNDMKILTDAEGLPNHYEAVRSRL